MLTVVIVSLKQGFLASQLHWLSQQTVKDFTVLVMDAFFPQNTCAPYIKKSYPFTLLHVPVIQNLSLPKRFDYSIKNNAALLVPTDSFVFLSDTAYVADTFVEYAMNAVLQRQRLTIFSAPTVSRSAYDSFQNTLDREGVTTHLAKPVIVFDKQLFIHVLNGYDEATTYASGYEFMDIRIVNTRLSITPIENQVWHILHAPGYPTFGRKHRAPCDRCDKLFPMWRFHTAWDLGDFPMDGPDSDMMQQWVFQDRLLGITMFQCPNCGFGGSVNPAEYERYLKNNRVVDAPAQVLEGRAGRSLAKVYETILKRVGSSLDSKLSYLTTTY